MRALPAEANPWRMGGTHGVASRPTSMSMTEGVTFLNIWILRISTCQLLLKRHPFIMIYYCITNYSWMGITAAVKWALKSRDHYHAHGVRRSVELLPGYSFVENLPTFEESLKAHALSLWSMKIPFDGDPPVVGIASEMEEEVDWDDGPDVDLDFVPDYVAPVSAPSTKAIAFDIFGTILDRDGAINEAMRLLSPTHPDNRRLSKLYLECELMRHRDHTDALYNDIVGHALQDVSTVLETPPSEAVLREAVQTILQPGLYADAEVAVKTLLIQGYVLVCLPVPGGKSFSLPQLPSGLTLHDQHAPLSDFFGQNHSMFSNLLERCRLKCETIDRNQILVVTFSRYRVMEPASMAGFPTILVQRPGCLESEAKLGTSDPTLVVDRLQDLQMQLQNLSAHHPSPILERTPIRVKEFRVCGIYQVTKLLGMGSFGMFRFGYFSLSNCRCAFGMTGNVSSAFNQNGGPIGHRPRPSCCLTELWCTTCCADTQGYRHANGVALIEDPIS